MIMSGIYFKLDLMSVFSLFRLINERFFIFNKSLNKHIFNFLSEINIFNKLLIFAWHDIAFSVESAVKQQQPTNVWCIAESCQLSLVVCWWWSPCLIEKSLFDVLLQLPSRRTLEDRSVLMI